jgi:hypothetical protein
MTFFISMLHVGEAEKIVCLSLLFVRSLSLYLPLNWCKRKARVNSTLAETRDKNAMVLRGEWLVSEIEVAGLFESV